MATTDTKLPRGRMGAESIDRVIRQAGTNRHTVIMDYESPKGETKTYELEGYSYRNGGMKFFAFDLMAKSIKAFDTTRIIRVEETEKTFKAQWPVELEVIS